MLTPVIGTEPTLGAESLCASDNAGSELGDVGVFEQVLHELLDSDIEEGELGVGISPHSLLISLPQSLPTVPEEASSGSPNSLPPSPLAWEQGHETLLVSLAGEPLEARAVETPIANAVEAEWRGLKTDSEQSLKAEAWVKAGETFLAHLTAEESSAETMIVLGGGLPSKQGGFEGLGQPTDPRSANGVEGALPVSSARQEETPPTPMLDSQGADPLALKASEPIAPKRIGQEHPDLTHTDRHLAHTPHPTHTTHGTTSAGQVETPPVATTAPTADPNWHTVEQMAQHIERMVYDRERDAITVRLDPPELGVIELRVHASGNEVQAWVSAERDLTRQLLQQAQQQLREQLESRGLQLTHFDVGGQSHSRFAQAQAQAQPPRTPAMQTPTATHPSMATDSLWYDGRWSVWV